jgi:hypothetical protein
VGSGVSLPDCKTPGQLLTYTSNGELSQYSCTPKGSITLSQTDQTTITNLNTQITLIGTTVMALGTGTPVSARTFRGLTPTPVNGAMGGTSAASASCVAAFGKGATMCDAYSMYISLAAGKIDVTKDLAGAWVYLADWTSGTATNFTVSSIPAVLNGLADNCAGYTTAATAGGVFGTKFSLVVGTGNATDRVPKFSNKTTCDTLLPVACCQ